MKKYFEYAVKNITLYGDTDIFPFPFENILFKENEEKFVKLLEEIHANFDNYISDIPIIHEKSLQTVGYLGYRWGTQIDAIWNAYFLGLVLSIADDIEKARLSTEKKKIFSYRYNYNEEKNTIFDLDYHWNTFHEEALNKSENYNYVLRCDISDFYPRIYHHRIENSLKKISSDGTIINKIMKILNDVSKNVSYGLPVGGPASRLLSELLLNRVDRLMNTENIEFNRYADDYLIFAKTREEAYEYLIYLSEIMQENEGLTLQKSKTQIMTVEEFRITSGFYQQTNETDTNSIEERNFLKLRLFYDPYSPSAKEDYEELSTQLAEFDIVGMLTREVNKSRINQTLTKRLISSIKYLDNSSKNASVLTMIENIEILYPVFSTMMIVIKSLIEELEPNTKEEVFKSLKNLYSTESYIVRIPIHQAFTIRLFAYDVSEETDTILNSIYKKSDSSMVKRDVILAMAQRNADYWISDIRKKYMHLTNWEKRAVLVSSYTLADEGKHWRQNTKKDLDKFNTLILECFSDRVQQANGFGHLL